MVTRWQQDGHENAIYQSRLIKLNCFSQSSDYTLEWEGVDQPDYEKRLKDKKCTLDNLLE